MSYRVFHRTWWKKDDSGKWPNGLEPCIGKDHTIEDDVETVEEARKIAREWNQENPPGRLSDKAEIEEN